MNIALWIAQVALAGLFGFAGTMKTFMYDGMMAKAPGLALLPRGLVTFIGITEILGALGLLLPMLLRVKPWLTSLAALGLGVIMLMAIPVHLMRGESVITNLLFLGLSLFVAYGRWRGTEHPWLARQMAGGRVA